MRPFALGLLVADDLRRAATQSTDRSLDVLLDPALDQSAGSIEWRTFARRP